MGVSWNQAKEYCAWRTDRVREYQQTNKKKNVPLDFEYRLPTLKEWEIMYGDISILEDTIGEEGPRRFRGSYRWNMKRAKSDYGDIAGKLNDNADITAPTHSYWPNKYGVYHIKGNVSEWISEKNTHVGGDWKTAMTEDVSVPKESETATSYIGFRCVCEVKGQ